MQIHQVNIFYQPAEDRLLMRINTRDAAEFRIWLTRAVVVRLLTGLAQSANHLPGHENNVTVNSRLQRAIEQFDREASMMENNTMTPFVTTASHYPLGQQPLLAIRLDVTPRQDHVSFAFSLSSNQLFTLNLTSSMMVSITRLLYEALKQVDWNLPNFTEKRPLINFPQSETVH